MPHTPSALPKVVMGWPLWARLFVAVLTVAAASGLQAICEVALGPVSEFLPFQFGAVLVAAVYLGTWPGIISVAISTLLLVGNLPPAGVFNIGQPVDLIVVTLYMVLGAAVVLLGYSRRMAEARANAAADTLGIRARELEAEIARRQHAEQELKLSNEKLEEFSHAVAHDLKEPLRGMLFTASFLEEDAASKLNADEIKLLHRLKHTAHQMAEMLSLALDYAREPYAEVAGTHVTTDTRRVAANVVEMLAPWLEEQNAKVTIREPLPSVHCDEASVTRVLTNLIANGVKYNKASPKLVEIGGRQEPQQAPLLYVRDNGIGIPPTQREKAFAMFRRLPTETSSGGTGAGLALTRRLIERHHGRIWIADEPGLEPGPGTTICFTLEPAPASEVPGRSA